MRLRNCAAWPRTIKTKKTIHICWSKIQKGLRWVEASCLETSSQVLWLPTRSQIVLCRGWLCLCRWSITRKNCNKNILSLPDWRHEETRDGCSRHPRQWPWKPIPTICVECTIFNEQGSNTTRRLEGCNNTQQSGIFCKREFPTVYAQPVQ